MELLFEDQGEEMSQSDLAIAHSIYEQFDRVPSVFEIQSAQYQAQRMTNNVAIPQFVQHMIIAVIMEFNT